MALRAGNGEIPEPRARLPLMRGRWLAGAIAAGAGGAAHSAFLELHGHAWSRLDARRQPERRDVP